MAVGKRKPRQQDLFLAADRIRAPGDPFYEKLNEFLLAEGFDEKAEALCAPYYSSHVSGRRSIPPGVMFRMFLVGYFEGLDSERKMDWRCADSLSLRRFLGFSLTETTPDHATMSTFRRRLPVAVFMEIFELVLSAAMRHGLLKRKGLSVAIDASLIEANASMDRVCRKDTLEDYPTYVRRLAEEAGAANPSDEELRRFDKKRKGKKFSNKDWQSETDPDARIARMKDGHTDLAYKVEHAVDLDSDLLLAAEVHEADRGDPDTFPATLDEAEMHVALAAGGDEEEGEHEEQGEDGDEDGSPECGDSPGQDDLDEADEEPRINEVMADRGYHKVSLLEDCAADGIRTYIPERSQPDGRRWDDKPRSQRDAFFNNRARVRRKKGKALQRLRSEHVERSFAHMCVTGGWRRSFLRGLENVQKGYLLAACARNLGVMLRRIFGIGKPRRLQDGACAFALSALAGFAVQILIWAFWGDAQDAEEDAGVENGSEKQGALWNALAIRGHLAEGPTVHLAISV